MAILKEITTNNGAIASYHRISNIQKDNDKLKVCLLSYANEAYRNKEKEFKDNLKIADSKIKRLNVLTGSKLPENMTEDEQKEIDELNAWFDNLTDLQNKGEFHMFHTDVELEREDGEDISFENIYTELVNNNEMFINGTMI